MNSQDRTCRNDKNRCHLQPSCETCECDSYIYLDQSNAVARRIQRKAKNETEIKIEKIYKQPEYDNCKKNHFECIANRTLNNCQLLAPLYDICNDGSSNTKKNYVCFTNTTLGAERME